MTGANAAVNSGKSLEKITLQLKWSHQFQFAGYYAAIEKGYYRDAGLEVDLKEGKPGVNIAEEVVSGRADFGVDMPGLLLERQKGLPIVILATIFQHSPEILIARKDSGIESPQDLIGRRVELRPRGSIETQAMLLNEGISLKDIDVIDHSWGIDALINKRVDASAGYITDRPFLLDKKGIPYTIIRPITYGINFYGDCLFTSEREITEHPERVKAFREASLLGWAYAMENPDEIIDIILDKYNPGLSREFLQFEAEATRKLMLPEFIEIGHMNPGRWRHIADTYVRLGMLRPGYSLEGFIYDPYPAPDYTWLHWTLGITISALLLISSASISLLVFNKRLHKAVKERTAELSKTNKDMVGEITGRKRTEVVLRESENRYRTLFESANDAIFIMKNDLFIDCNQRALEVFGCTREQIINQPPYYRFSPPMQPDNRKSAEKALEKIKAAYNDNPQFFEWKHQKYNGELFDAEVSLNSIKLVSGKYLQAIVRDVTDRKHAEEELKRYRMHLEDLVKERTGELEKANEKLRELDRLKSMFIASMSHELRTPLNSIIGFTGILLQGMAGGINNEQRDQLRRVYGSAKHLLELITDVIDISKIEAGKIEVYVEEFRLDKVIKEAVSSLATQADSKGVGIETAIPHDLILKTDRRRLLQCVLNYLSNAVKFTGKGKITVTARESGGMIEISVEDTGIGIKEEDIPELFNSFVRLDSHLKTITPGTGLGLYLTKKLVNEALGGTVSVESRYGEGSMFALKIPKEL